jgi:zinc protease
MKSLPLLLLALSISISGCSLFSRDEAPVIKVDVQEKDLSNGMKVLMIEDHSLPVVSYQTWVKVGSVDEQFGKTGIAHLFEHLMFKGTEKYPPKSFFRELEAKGANVNAYTTRDYTVYFVNATKNLLPKIIDMESDRLANLKVTRELLNVERQVVFNERRMRVESSPAGRIREALWENAFRQHPYKNPVIGYPADLLGLTIDDMNAFFKKFYHPSNVTLIVSGDFDPDDLMDKIEENYASIGKDSPKTPKRAIDPDPPQTSERRIRLDDRVASPQFAHGYHITEAGSSETYAIDVLANILFEGAGSRAYRSLVEEKQILIGLDGTSYTPTYPGLLFVIGTLRAGKSTKDAESGLNEVFKQVKDEGVTKEEVAIAIRQITVDLIDAVQSPYGLAQYVGTVHTILGHYSKMDKEIALYDAVTAEQVQAVAKKYLRPNNRTSVLMLPKGAKKEGVNF